MSVEAMKSAGAFSGYDNTKTQGINKQSNVGAAANLANNDTNDWNSKYGAGATIFDVGKMALS